MKKEKFETLLTIWKVIDTTFDIVQFIVRICCMYITSHKLLPDILFRAMELLFLETRQDVLYQSIQVEQVRNS